jgi:hypothetical protein
MVAPATDRLSAEVRARHADHPVTLADLWRDPVVAALAETEATGTHALIDLLDRLVEQGDAIRTPAPLTLFTLRRDGETVADLWDRHVGYLIDHRPDDYIHDALCRHQAELHPPADRPRYRHAAELALQDGRLCAAWYPEGVPDLRAAFTGPALAHFRAYCAALRHRADVYAAAIARGPRELRREVEASRLPCRPRDRRGPDPQLRRIVVGAPVYPQFWLPLTAEPRTLYLLVSAHDPVTERRHPVLGRTELPPDGYEVITPFEAIPSAHRCCPELAGWILLVKPWNRTRPLRFHLSSTPLPPIPTVRPHRRLALGAPPVPLRPLGWLATATSINRPWTGLLLWADTIAPRVWEEVSQAQLTKAIHWGRHWDPAAGRLLDPTGGTPIVALQEEVDRALFRALPYTLSNRLHQL